MTAASQVEKIMAPGVDLEFINGETGEVRTFNIKFTPRAMYLLEKEFGSLEEVVTAMQGLLRGGKKAEWELLWEVVTQHPGRDDLSGWEQFIFDKFGGNAFAAQEYVRSLMIERQPVNRMETLAKLLYPALHKHFASWDEVIDWLSIEHIAEQIESVVGAMFQALPGSSDDEKEEGQEGNVPAPVENQENPSPSTGDSSTTSPQSDLVGATSNSGTE